MNVLTPKDIGPEVLNTGKVAVFLTSTHCHACHKLSEIFYSFRTKAADDVTMIHVNMGEDPDPLRYAKGMKQLTGWPFTLVYRDGQIRDMWYGVTTEQEYHDRMARDLT